MEGEWWYSVIKSDYLYCILCMLKTELHVFNESALVNFIFVDSQINSRIVCRREQLPSWQCAIFLPTKCHKCCSFRSKDLFWFHTSSQLCVKFSSIIILRSVFSWRCQFGMWTFVMFITFLTREIIIYWDHYVEHTTAHLISIFNPKHYYR